jgi:hypothetical protein
VGKSRGIGGDRYRRDHGICDHCGRQVSPTKCTSHAKRVMWGNVRYWHKADIGLRGVNVCFGGKASGARTRNRAGVEGVQRWRGKG